jgi:2-polyprenyl-3-methyl-5-hydroxy-6-metoxy-1,4-benzoquinol methylase
MKKTVDPVNQVMLDLLDTIGPTRLGVMNNMTWHDDPRRLVFTLARYKFVAKMFSGRKNVVEIGCGDAFGSRIVKQEVGSLTVTDIDPAFLDDIKSRQEQEVTQTKKWPLRPLLHDYLKGALAGDFDAAFALDVLEHIKPAQEDVFLKNVAGSLSQNAALIIGIPSLESQSYASDISKAGHVNCKTGADLKATMERHFHNVFLFSMNDEVVHTGYARMAHYLLALCTGKR